MDFAGILKEAWETTWRHRALWILGLFTAGAGGVSSFNWQTNAQDFQSQPAKTDWRGFEELRPEFERVGREVEQAFSANHVGEWLPWVLLGVGVLLLIGMVLWVLSVAAKGGLVHQTNEALAGNDVSARAGWRAGFANWGRVFLVGFALALPQILVAGVIAGVVALVVGTAAAVADPGPGALGLLAILPFAALIMIALSVIVGMLREVALRRAVLDDAGALDGIKAAWADLWGKRGVAGMWLVMLLVGIGSGILGGIVMIPLVITVALITGGAVVAGGVGGLWVLLPLGLIVIAVGMLIKAVYQTFVNAAWTSFYRRMNATVEPEPEVADAA